MMDSAPLVPSPLYIRLLCHRLVRLRVPHFVKCSTKHVCVSLLSLIFTHSANCVCVCVCVCVCMSMRYSNHEVVVLWMNTVGPYHNRQETYTYFSLPFCKGPRKEIGHYHETLGEALQLEFSGLEISFKGSGKYSNVHV